MQGLWCHFQIISFYIILTPAGKVTNKLSNWISLKLAERSEATSAKRSFASKHFKFSFLTRSFASRFLLRSAIFQLLRNKNITSRLRRHSFRRLQSLSRSGLCFKTSSPFSLISNKSSPFCRSCRTILNSSGASRGTELSTELRNCSISVPLGVFSWMLIFQRGSNFEI